MRRPFDLAQVGDHIHLILHQGDERGDDDSRSFHQQRWQLVAQGLTATRRHQHKGVITIQQIPDDALLISLEFVESKVLLQSFGKIDLFGHK